MADFCNNLTNVMFYQDSSQFSWLTLPRILEESNVWDHHSGNSSSSKRAGFQMNLKLFFLSYNCRVFFCLSALLQAAKAINRIVLAKHLLGKNLISDQTQGETIKSVHVLVKQDNISTWVGWCVATKTKWKKNKSE